MRAILLYTLLLSVCFSKVSAQIINFTPTTTGTGFLPSNNSSGGISWVIDNTNPYGAQLTTLSYYNSTAVTRDYQLWWAPTSVTMPITFPPSGAGGWTNIAVATGVNMAAGVQTTIFSGLTFVIPGNTAYRFYLTSSNVQYKGIGGPTGVSPTIFTNTGVNLLVGEAQYNGNNVGWGGGNFSPRAFLGAITLNLLGPPCVGQPTAGVAAAGPNNPCPGTNVTLSLTGTTAASALVYQWQRGSSASGPWLSLPGATTSTYLYQPPAGSITYYRCIVVCITSGLADTSNVAGPIAVQSWSPTSPCYCTNTVTSTLTNDIGQVTFGTFVNPIGAPPNQTSNASANGGYTNFMALSPSPTYTQGLNYNINVHQITSATTLTTCWTKVWIDFNHNANFTDPGEEVFSSTSSAANGFSPSGSIYIPPTSLPGCTRMRVKTQTAGSATITTPCNTIASGEVEDYIICISPAGPYDPTISAISAPTGNNCTGATETLSATVCNYGSSPINLSTNPAYIIYTVGSPLGIITYLDTLDTGTIPAFGSSCATSVVTPVNMFTGGNYFINATVAIPSLSNAFPGNDSLPTAINIFNYRPLAGPPYHLCQYNNVPFGQGLTVGGCSAPLSDSVEIIFNLTPCIDNVGAVVAGTTLGPGNANCNNTYAGNFANGLIPTLPSGAYFTQNAVLTVDHLSSGFPTELRFILYSGSPVGSTLYAGCATGFNTNAGNIVLAGQSIGPATNFTNTRHITPAQLSNLFGSLAVGSTFNIGYWETFNDAPTASDIGLNAGGSPTTAKLKVYYQYVPPAFAWYDVPTGGISLYSLSPFDPLSVPNAVVNNSNVADTFSFYAACLGLPDCRVPVDIIIDPTPAAYQDTLHQCEFAVSANNGIFNLPSADATVSGNNLAASVAYFGDQALLSAIPTPATDTSSTNYIYSKVFYPSTGCFSSDTVYLDVSPIPQFTQPVYSGFACAPNAIDISSLITIISPSPVDSIFYDDQSYTGLHPNPHAIYSVDTVYMVVKTSTGVVCSDTSTAYIDIIPASNNIASQNTSGNYSMPGPIPCGTITLTNGNTETLYTTNDCRKVAKVTDSPLDLIDLGNVTICEDVYNGVPTHVSTGSNPQPYVNRSYEITPTTNGKATVCLYYLDQDFADYDAYASLSTPTWPSITPGSNLVITQVDNGDLNTPGHTAITIPNSSITSSYDPSTTVWTVCFPVDSFSFFYAHTANPFNIPLPVSLLSFTGKAVDGSSHLNWTTSSEQNNSHFILERSSDAKNFRAISSKINSKALNGNSQVKLDYSYEDKTPLNGHNHYRLQQVDIDGHVSYSGTVDVYFGDETMVTLYPNPVNTELNIDINTPKATTAYVKIMDATGRVVRMVETSLQAGNNTTKIDLQSLVDGMYMVQITNNKGLNYTQAIRKK